MKNCDMYDDALMRYIYTYIIITVIVCLFIVVALIYVKRQALMGVSKYIISFGLGFVLLMYGIVILPIQKDIIKNDYVQYTGTFFVEDYYFSKSGAYILIKKPDSKKAIRYRAPNQLNNIYSETNYNGTYTYAKNSKILVNIQAKESVGDNNQRAAL